MPDDVTTNDDQLNDDDGQGGGATQFASLNDVDPEELNRFISQKKRKIMSDLSTATKKAKAFDSLQGQVQKVLDSDMFEGAEVDGLEDWVDQAQTTINQFRTDAEILGEDNKKAVKARDKAFQERDAAVEKFNTAQIKREVADHSLNRVLDEGGLEFLELKFAAISEVQEDGSVLVNWQVPDEDEEGKTKPGKVTMKDAIDSMEAQAKAGERYRGVFKSTVQGGSGGGPNNASGGGNNSRQTSGGLDINEIINDPAKYQAAMAKDPAAVQEALANIRPFAD